ncbi:hypothetical protein [Chryseosolibacter indicus]|uniref:PKD domain-containing protein n=1 Tax=Chryseosolibacter indicus TaxID=2782351 RepID=A0ABS5VUL7_9BACT|nr:hypothetical protein [Chryseosolibacter indicus]MBT1704525.1 hypothetical protein [Chryseosolibacter indicus]
MKKFKIYILTSAILFCLLFSCTDPEETMSWRPGSSLHIIGEGEITVGEEFEYYVDGYTINETYTWTLDGAAITPTRGGEFVILNFNSPGTHSLSVTNGRLTGTMEIVAE